MRERPSLLVALLPAALGVLLALSKQGERTVDDAFILFRYAENLANGQGATFNPGERVEGHSSLAFVLALAAGYAGGLPCVLTSNLLNLLGVAMACGGAALVARELLPSPLLPARRALDASTCLVAGLLAATSDGLVNWGLLGLETAFAAGLTAAALARRLAEDRTGAGPWLSGALFGLLGITRPEAPMSYLLTAVGALLAGGSVPREVRRASLAVGLPAAQVAFRLAYYGELLPNTFHAKIWSGWDRYERGLAYVAEALLGRGQEGAAWRAPLLLAALAGLLLIRPLRTVATVLLVAAGGIAFGVYSGGDYYTSHRFLVPTSPALFALLAAGAGRAVRALPGGVAILIALGAATSAAAPGFGSWRAYASPPAALPARIAENVARLAIPSETVQVKVGRFLGKQLPPAATLTVGDCGRIPYFSRLRVVDSLGLMDPVVARSPGKVNEKLAAGYLIERATDYALLRQAPLDRYPEAGGLRIDHLLIHDPRFHATRRLAAWFPFGRHALYLFARETEVVDLAAQLSSGDAVAGGEVRAGTGSARLPPEQLRALAALLDAHPFEMLPDDDAARLFRYLWAFPTVELAAGSRITWHVAQPCRMELGLDAGSSVDVRQGAQVRRLAGPALLLGISLDAGEVVVEGRRPSRLLVPRLVRR